MTSITIAPRPINAAHLNPRREPSLRIVRLIGPTGMERSSPLMRPVKPASRMGGSSGMRGHWNPPDVSSSSSSISSRILREIRGRMNP